MPLTQETLVVHNPVTTLIKSSIMSAFTFLTALSIRDVFTSTLKAALKHHNENRGLIFVYLYACIIFLVTTLLAYLFSNTAPNPAAH